MSQAYCLRGPQPSTVAVTLQPYSRLTTLHRAYLPVEVLRRREGDDRAHKGRQQEAGDVARELRLERAWGGLG